MKIWIVYYNGLNYSELPRPKVPGFPLQKHREHLNYLNLYLFINKYKYKEPNLAEEDKKETTICQN
jgi:hypothetical protein